jgi:predicted GNAT family acetyltransferase
MNATHFNIEHQADQQRFCIAIGDDEAVLEYKLLDEHTLDFTRTYVPFRHRGQGHAEALVHAGLAWANTQGYSIKASCWYVDKFLKQDTN